jgi:hypothetical protein
MQWGGIRNVVVSFAKYARFFFFGFFVLFCLGM